MRLVATEALCRELIAASPYDVLANLSETLLDPLRAQLLDGRAQIVAQTCAAIGVAAAQLGPDGGELADALLPLLIDLVGCSTAAGSIGLSAHRAACAVLLHVPAYSVLAPMFVTLSSPTTTRAGRGRLAEQLLLLLRVAGGAAAQAQRFAVAARLCDDDCARTRASRAPSSGDGALPRRRSAAAREHPTALQATARRGCSGCPPSRRRPPAPPSASGGARPPPRPSALPLRPRGDLRWRGACSADGEWWESSSSAARPPARSRATPTPAPSQARRVRARARRRVGGWPRRPPPAAPPRAVDADGRRPPPAQRRGSAAPSTPTRRRCRRRGAAAEAAVREPRVPEHEADRRRQLKLLSGHGSQAQGEAGADALPAMEALCCSKLLLAAPRLHRPAPRQVSVVL